MRISVNKNDPGYVPDPYMYEVYLNDQRLDNAYMADEEAGEVGVRLDFGRNETLYGKVRIVREGDAACLKK